MKARVASTLIIIFLPVAITTCFKLTTVSIGPVVLFYPIIGGLVLGAMWAHAMKPKYGVGIAFAMGIIFSVIAFIGLLNLFIGVTAAMGEMDYSLI